MRVKTRMWLGMSLLGCLILMGSLITAYYVRLEISADQLQEEKIKLMEQVRDMQVKMVWVIMPPNDYCIHGDSIEEKKFHNAYNDIMSRIKKIKASQGDGKERNALLVVEDRLHEVKRLAGRIFEISSPVGDPEAARLMVQLDAEAAKTEQSMKEVKKLFHKRQGQAMQTASRMREKLTSITLAISVLLISGLITFFYYIFRNVSRPMFSIIRMTKKIAGGDFSQRFSEERDDEYGTLHKTFNFMLDSLEDREKRLVSKNLELNSTVEELEATNEKLQLSNEELESTNEELQISSEELESANEELNVSNQELETNTRDLAETRSTLEKKNKELQQAHDYLETIINHTNSGICVVGSDHRIESVNQTFQKTVGYTESELIGVSCYQIFHQATEPCPECPIDKLPQNGGTYRHNHHFLRKDGEKIIVDVTTTPLSGQDGRVERVIETTNDVTKVTTLNRELKEQKERMRSTLMNMAEGVSVINNDYTIEFINDLLKRQFGEIVGHKCYQAFRGFDRPCSSEPCSLDEILKKGKKRFEIIKRNEDGKYFRMTSVPLRNPDETLSMIQIRQDVTQQKEFEEERKRYTEQLEQMNRRMEEEVEKQTLELRDTNMELRLSNERLMEMNREKSEFIDIAVHDLRTPLTSILSYAEILRKYHDEPPETRAEFLGIIISESFRMKQLISDYLDLSKLESGFVDFQEDEINIFALIKDILPTFQSRVEEQEIRIVHNLAQSMPRFTADPGRIRQVFINLLDNAVKYTPPGGEIHLIGEVQKQQRMLRFTVQDSGEGIDEKDQEKLFRKFGRIVGGKSKKLQGSGLGLSIAKTIVEHYEGNIWVKSRKGKGSRFIFTLPLDRHRVLVRHSVSMSKTTSELTQQMASLWKDYLEQNYVCVYSGSPVDIDRIKENLFAQDVDVYDLMEKEQIIFGSSKNLLLNKERCNGELLFTSTAKLYERLMELPWDGLVVARDMSRLLSDERSRQEVFYFEKKIDRYLKKFKKPLLMICRYNPEDFSEMEIVNLRKIHSYSFTEGKVVTVEG